MRRRLVQTAATLLLSGFTFAGIQTPRPPTDRAAIEGTVARADSGQPLKGARVTLRRATAQPPALVGGIAAGEVRSIVSSIATAVATVTTDGNGIILHSMSEGAIRFIPLLRLDKP